MIRSMTGYGRGETQRDGLTLVAELRAVNNRYLDCTVKMPRSYLFAEDAMKKRVQEKVGRGKVDVFISVTQTAQDDQKVTVNEGLAKEYIEALKTIWSLGGGYLKDESYPTSVARFPDVLTVEKKEEDPEAVKEQLLETLELALDDFNAMRAREGQRLKEDILSRGETIKALVGKVEAQSPQTVTAYRERLEAKLKETLQNTQIDESRILTEAAIFADKVAVDEETVRLRSHLEQLAELLDGDGGVGRKLDFLIQEFNREANTIGSKCSDISITKVVVDMKAEIEKIREQVQNIE
ncbi:MAG: YicC family protein [Oscillospiraceae bacterium]